MITEPGETPPSKITGNNTGILIGSVVVILAAISTVGIMTLIILKKQGKAILSNLQGSVR